MRSPNDIADKLHAQGLLSSDTVSKLREEEGRKLFSVHGELTAILYTGVLSLSMGLGLFVYNNISTIGHLSIIALIGLVSCGCFYFCFREALIFSRERVEAFRPVNDYLLLLACLTQVTFFGYLEYQYHLFGTTGMEFLIPALVCFAAAYYFDHLGALSVAIASLGAFFGIAVSPLNKHMYENFDDTTEIGTGLLLALLLTAAGFVTERKIFKAHFAFTYYHFALHVFWFGVIAGLFVLAPWALLLPLIVLVSWRVHTYALKSKSFYFFLINGLYSYICLCCLFVKLIDKFNLWGELAIYYSLFLLIGSSIGMIYIIRSFRTKINA